MMKMGSQLMNNRQGKQHSNRFTRQQVKRFNFIFSLAVVVSLVVVTVQPAFAEARFSYVDLLNFASSVFQLPSGITPNPPPPEVKTVPPVQDPHLPTLSLQVATNPDPITVGDTVTVTVTLANAAPDPANQVVLTLPTPDGAQVLPGTTPAATQASQAHGWQWNMAQLAGGTTTTFSATLQVSTMPTGQALLLQPQVMAHGLPQPVQTSGGALVDPVPTTNPPLNENLSGANANPNLATATNTPTNTTEINYDPSKDAVLKSADGRVEVKIPAGAASTPLKIKHSPAKDKKDELKAKGKDLPPDVAGNYRGFGTFFLDATDANGQDFHKFDKDLTVTLHYTSQQLAALGRSEQDLTLFWFDDTKTTNAVTGQKQKGQWVPVVTQFDPATHTVSASVNHFTGFQFSDGSSPSQAFLPSLQGFQDNLYMGSAGYNYPIELPAGPNGIKPNLNLSYNSATTDNHAGGRPMQQAGWVGNGWSLDTGAVSMNKVGNGGSYYTLAFDGASYDIVREEALVGNADPNKPEQWVWRPTDENYIKIRYVASPSKWQAWSKDGTLYEFAQSANWAFCDANGSLPPKVETYSWKLTSRTDTHGNRINYTYGRVHYIYGDACHMGTSPDLDEDVYPLSISWGGNVNQGTPDRYRVDFGTSARGYDTQREKTSLQVNYVWQTRELDTIQVYSNPSNPFDGSTNGWQKLRQYNLCYAISSNTGGGCSAYTSTPATRVDYGDNGGYYPRLTLMSIQRLGNDFATALPATTFGYGMCLCQEAPYSWMTGSWNRLISVNNGQGGTISLSYENVGTWLATHGWDSYISSEFSNIRRLTQKTITDGQGHSYPWTYNYGTPNINSFGRTLPKLPGIGTQGGTNSATLFFNYYWSNHLNSDDQQWLIHQMGWEFRGHPSTTVTDPNGNQTEHYFYQGDYNGAECAPYGYPTIGSYGDPSNGNYIYSNTCFQKLRDQEFLKGKEWLTRVRGPVSAGSPIYQETQHTFTVNFLDYGPYILTGLWHAFTYESQTTTRLYEGGGTPLASTTNYVYSSNYQAGGGFYGNLGRVDELDQTGALYRRTEHWYATRDDGTNYLVDREWATGVGDGQKYLSFGFNFYDGYTMIDPATLHLPVGTKGDVTMTRQIFDLPAGSLVAGQPLHGVDSTLAYDAYGNPITTTTYVGNGQTPSYAGAGVATWNSTGWVFGSAGNGAAGLTTTTTYDNLFHTFPTQVTQPPATGGATPMNMQAGYDYRMGVLNSITDENGVQSTAGYDQFGRMTYLVKPGDSSASPTYQTWYYDNVIPFKYAYVPKDNTGGRPIIKFYDGMGRLMQTKGESVDGLEHIVTDQVYDGLGQVTQTSQPRYVDDSTNFWNYVTPSTDPNVMKWTTTTYDPMGRPLKVTTPDNTFSTHFYGLTYEGSLLRGYHHVVDANRHLPNSSRTDEFGRLVKVYEYTGNCGGLAGYGCGGSYTTAYAPYAITNYSYSVLDQLKQVTDNANNITTLNYDSLGRKTSMSDPDMGTWSYFYDVAGNLIQQTDAKSQSITFTYDQLNRLITKNGAYTQNVFFSDSFNGQNGSNWSWNSSYQTVPFNDNGNNVVKSTGNGVDTSEGVGRVGNNLSSGMGAQVRFRVDSTTTNAHFFVDNGTGGYRRFGAVANNGKLYTEYTTDGVNWTYPGDLISTLQTNVWYVLKIELDDTNGFKIQVNQESNPSVQGSYTTTMPGGMSWHFAHLTQNGNTYMDDYREYTIGTPASNYYYDDTVSSGYGKGRRTSITNSGGTTRWFYDNRGRVTKTDYTLAGLTGTRSFQTTYDNADRVTSVQYPNLANPTDPNGEIVSYSYDAAWRPTQACSNLSGTPCYASAAQYNSLSQPMQLTFGNTLQQNWTYSSPMSRLSQLRVGTSAAPGSLFDRSYTYDNASNVKTISNNISWQAQTQNFTYDDLDRLNHAWTSGSTSNGTNVKINFQTSTSATPSGYLPDSGAVYGDRGNGYTYGWNADNSANARDRDAQNSPDQRYDTFTHMQKLSNPNAYWEIAVPNGTYTVRVVAGDPSNYGDATFKINVENVLALEGSPTSDNHWFDQTAVVQVTDGKLTVSNATGSNNNKIDFIEITSGPGAYDESYSYDTIGNITSKAGVSYTYPAGGSARPHTSLTVGGAVYSYDGNGNLLSGGGRSYTWNVENKPIAITGPDGVTEGYNYDADGERVSRSRSGTTTYYFGGMWEEDSTGTIRVNYQLGEIVVATRQRVSGVDALTYLHGDHLGSVSLATSSSGAAVSQQEFDPWGKVRLGGLSQTSLNYTGQRLDGTGLLYYHARMYDPSLSKFVSPDSIVSGAASGKGGGATVGWNREIELRSLTVDFSLPGFASILNAENAFTTTKGFWFELDNNDKRKARWQWGPINPQSLNRYGYVLNNPLRYSDPTGHDPEIISGGDSQYGYKEQCTTSGGEVGDCGGVSEKTGLLFDPKNRVYRKGSSARLVRAWSGGESKFVWSDEDEFNDFKDKIKDFGGSKKDVANAAVGLFIALTALLGCLSAGKGLCITLWLAYFAAGEWLQYTQNELSKAEAAVRKSFTKISDKGRYPRDANLPVGPIPANRPLLND